MSELKDWRGTPITEGCHVVYPVRQSSSMWMNEAEVSEIVETTLWGRQTYHLRCKLVSSAIASTNESARQRKVVTISAVHRVTVV